ncbi:MAG: hypothetical protein ABSG60_02805 [Terracidiphilus sp.]
MKLPRLFSLLAAFAMFFADNTYTVAVTTSDTSFYVCGLNNNGQIAGTYFASYSYPFGFFINTDGTIESVIYPGDISGMSNITGLNDDVQMAGTSDLGGFTIDTQH